MGRWEQTVFLHLGTSDVLDWIIPCWGRGAGGEVCPVCLLHFWPQPLDTRIPLSPPMTPVLSCEGPEFSRCL